MSCSAGPKRTEIITAQTADRILDLLAKTPSIELIDFTGGAPELNPSFRSMVKRSRSLGYGQEGSGLTLDLVFNPGGAFLPPSQEKLEKQYKRELWEQFRIVFNRLYVIVNMSIHRWAEYLERTGQKDRYRELLVNAFNPQTVDTVMCRMLISIGWNGQLYDCDFNQMLEIPVGGKRMTLWNIASFEAFNEGPIATSAHCFACTAGAGSSCGGSLIHSEGGKRLL